jgi:hypothetical protein
MVFVALIILDGNSQVCFHKPMPTKSKAETTVRACGQTPVINDFTITRHPNILNELRGQNSREKICQKCQQKKTHGFEFFEPMFKSKKKAVPKIDKAQVWIFVCDDCLAAAEKDSRKDYEKAQEILKEINK